MGILDAFGGGGVDWSVRLDRDELLPGYAAQGTVRFVTNSPLEVRAVVAALIATEQWMFETTTRDSDGNLRTERHTRREELRRLPVNLLGPAAFGSGQETTLEFSVPVPPLGPASFEAQVSRLSWELEIKMDVPGFDPSVIVPVRVLQPTALLRAGVLDLPAFALYPETEGDRDGIRFAIAFDPVPLCMGAPFIGSLLLDSASPVELQEIRLDLKMLAKATVFGGLEEAMPLWSGRISGPGPFGGPQSVHAFGGELPSIPLPSIRLPHGRSDAFFEATLARAWAGDTRLTRDVGVCTTTET